MRTFRILPALLLIGAAPTHRYTLDAKESAISAKVAFFGLASKSAGFPRASGGITLSPDARERIDLVVTLDATALTAPDSVTLARLKGPNFFDVARYPTVTFRGRTMRMTSDRHAEVAGQITARGVTKPAILTVRFAAPPARADGTRPLVLTGETVIDRRDFGITAYPFIVGRKVAITIRAAMVPS